MRHPQRSRSVGVGLLPSLESHASAACRDLVEPDPTGASAGPCGLISGLRRPMRCRIVAFVCERPRRRPVRERRVGRGRSGAGSNRLAPWPASEALIRAVERNGAIGGGDFQRSPGEVDPNRVTTSQIETTHQTSQRQVANGLSRNDWERTPPLLSHATSGTGFPETALVRRCAV